MGVSIRKKGDKWYVFVNYEGKRRAKCVGSRAAAEQVKRVLEAKLALGDLAILADSQQVSFQQYASRWMKEYAEVENKPSSVVKHEQVLRLYLLPQFGSQNLRTLRRNEIKTYFSRLAATGKLSRNSLRLILSTFRVILNHAVEDELLNRNPAEKLGRFTKVDGEQKTKASAMTREEAERFLESARATCPDFYPLFLTALRAGLRRGELIALQWGDIQFGSSETDSNRYILVQRNFVYGKFTSPKSKRSRRVDLSRQLRQELLAHRDKRLLKAFVEGKTSIADDLVFPSHVGSVLDPENLYNRYFLPALEHAGLRRFRLHDLRHTFGSLLIQGGASLTYVKEQMGHSSIQITVDIYGHLIPGADVKWIDRLDSATTTQQLSATPAQPEPFSETVDLPQVVEWIGGPGGIRTPDQGIMSPLL